MALSPADVEDIFRRSGALLEGHFVLASGRHSDRYLEKFQVLQWPRETERLCAEIVERTRGLDVDTVAGPTTGGIILAHEVARQIGTRAVYAERDEDRPRGRVFKRGFALAPDARVLVVDDILTTGGSVQETIDAVRSSGARVIGAAVLADRSGGGASFDVPLVALWAPRIESWSADGCPHCAAGDTPRKPGTTPAAVAR
jgi:orotate phosphoribosyltransferase